MPDAFGRELQDYEHLRDLGSGAMDFLRRRAAMRNQAPHNFNALDDFRRMRVETNAQAVGYVTNNLQAIDSMIYEIMYTQHRLPMMIPMNTRIPEGAETWGYRVVDGVGVGAWIDTDGTALPSATAAQSLVSYVLGYAGIAARWTVDNLRVAQFGGFGLAEETLQKAVEGSMDHMEMVGFSGDSTRGFVGLTNLPAAASPNDSQVRINDATGTFAARRSTPANLVSDLQGYIETIISGTNEVLGGRIRSPLYVYLPISQAGIVLHTRLSDINMTVWDYFRENNLWTEYTGNMPELRILQELTGVAPSAEDRMIIAVYDPMVFEMGVPIAPRARETQINGLEISVPFEYKFSGVQLKIPRGIEYVDGI